MAASGNAARSSRGDVAFYAIVDTAMMAVLLVVLYPLIFVLSSSFSSPSAVMTGRVVLWPVDFSLEGYAAVFRNRDVLTGYVNSVLYMSVGTLLNVAATMIAAYPLSRKDTPLRKTFTFLFAFTMFFSGGLIPNYILMRGLGLIDTFWVMVLPGAIGVWNLIVARTFIQNSIPAELFEAASIDGCSDARYFRAVILPLSKAVIAVIALYYAVGHWNAFFDALIYLNKRALYPLQLFLREVLVANTINPALEIDPELLERKQGMADLLKYSLIVVSTVPMLAVYPFAQKYFVKGAMVGSLKG